MLSADGEDPGGVLIALAAQTVRYCRDNPAEALAMTLFRHEHLMEIVPDSLHDRAEHINDGAFAMLAELGAKRFPDRADDPQLLELVYVCVIGLCYGLIRPYIMTGSPIPEWLDDVITRGCRGALSAGDL